MSEHFLLFEPEHKTAPTLKRIQGLARAIEMAGGTPRLLPNSFSYDYAQDLFILIGPYAFYPSIFGKMEEKRRNFGDVLEGLGYQLFDIGELPQQMWDGGNVICDDHNECIAMGQPRHFDSARFVARGMANHTGYADCVVEMAHLHLDCCLGLLPNGNLLVKLDETASNHGHTYGGGVTDFGLDVLKEFYPRDRMITFSFAERDEADFVLGLDKTADLNTGKPLSLLTNFTTVGSTIIGEQFPPDLEEALKSRGVSCIKPSDVGLKSFLPRMEGFVGGARCSALKVTDWTAPGAKFEPKRGNVFRFAL